MRARRDPPSMLELCDIARKKEFMRKPNPSGSEFKKDPRVSSSWRMAQPAVNGREDTIGADRDFSLHSKPNRRSYRSYQSRVSYQYEPAAPLQRREWRSNSAKATTLPPIPQCTRNTAFRTSTKWRTSKQMIKSSEYSQQNLRHYETGPPKRRERSTSGAETKLPPIQKCTRNTTFRTSQYETEQRRRSQSFPFIPREEVDEMRYSEYPRHRRIGVCLETDTTRQQRTIFRVLRKRF